VLAARGELDAAEAVAVEVIRMVEGTDCIELQGEALLHLGEVHRRGGRPERADELAEEARRRFERKGNRVAAARVDAALRGHATSPP